MVKLRRIVVGLLVVFFVAMQMALAFDVPKTLAANDTTTTSTTTTSATVTKILGIPDADPDCSQLATDLAGKTSLEASLVSASNLCTDYAKTAATFNGISAQDVDTLVGYIITQQNIIADNYGETVKNAKLLMTPSDPSKNSYWEKDSTGAYVLSTVVSTTVSNTGGDTVAVPTTAEDESTSGLALARKFIASQASIDLAISKIYKLQVLLKAANDKLKINSKTVMPIIDWNHTVNGSKHPLQIGANAIPKYKDLDGYMHNEKATDPTLAPGANAYTTAAGADITYAFYQDIQEFATDFKPFASKDGTYASTFEPQAIKQLNDSVTANVDRCGSGLKITDTLSVVVITYPICQVIVMVQELAYQLLLGGALLLSETSGIGSSTDRNPSVVFFSGSIPSELKSVNLQGKLVGNGTNHAMGDLVVHAHTIVLGALNFFLILFLLVIALANVFQVQVSNYQLKKVLPGVLIGFLLANVSLPFMRAGLEVSAAVTNGIFELNYKELDTTATYRDASTPSYLNAPTTQILKKDVQSNTYCSANDSTGKTQSRDLACLVASVASVGGDPHRLLAAPKDVGSWGIPTAVGAIGGAGVAVAIASLIPGVNLGVWSLIAIGAFVGGILGYVVNYNAGGQLVTTSEMVPSIPLMFQQAVLNIFVIIGAGMFFSLGVLFMVRPLVFYFLAPLAPIAMFGMMIPQMQGNAKRWWSTFSGWLFMPVVATFWIWLAFMWVQAVSSTQGGGTVAVDLNAAPPSIPPIVYFVSYGFMLICLRQAIMTPFSMAGEAKSALTAVDNFRKNAWKRTGGAALQQPKKWGIDAAKTLYGTSAVATQVRNYESWRQRRKKDVDTAFKEGVSTKDAQKRANEIENLQEEKSEAQAQLEELMKTDTTNLSADKKAELDQKKEELQQRIFDLTDQMEDIDKKPKYARYMRNVQANVARTKRDAVQEKATSELKARGQSLAVLNSSTVRDLDSAERAATDRAATATEEAGRLARMHYEGVNVVGAGTEKPVPGKDGKQARDAQGFRRWTPETKNAQQLALTRVRTDVRSRAAQQKFGADKLEGDRKKAENRVGLLTQTFPNKDVDYQGYQEGEFHKGGIREMIKDVVSGDGGADGYGKLIANPAGAIPEARRIMAGPMVFTQEDIENQEKMKDIAKGLGYLKRFHNDLSTGRNPDAINSAAGALLKLTSEPGTSDPESVQNADKWLYNLRIFGDPEKITNAIQSGRITRDEAITYGLLKSSGEIDTSEDAHVRLLSLYKTGATYKRIDYFSDPAALFDGQNQYIYDPEKGTYTENDKKTGWRGFKVERDEANRKQPQTKF